MNLRRLHPLILASALLVPLGGCGARPGEKTPKSLEPPDSAAANAAVTASRANALVTAAAKCTPAVVTVDTVQTIRRRVFNPFFSAPWQDFFRDFAPTPYEDYEEQVPAMGSGFIFDADGYILTAEHVIHGADKIEVTLPDNRKFPATWLGSDYQHDVAVLKIDATGLPAVTLGDSSSALIGEWAIAIGNPFGTVVESPSPTVSVGVVSALHRQMKGGGAGGIRVYDDLIQTDAAINPGNSGGPLVNALGEALGINVTIISTSGGSLGIGFAVPVNDARDVARQLIAESGAPPRWIGAYVMDVTPAVARAFNLPANKGVLVGDLDENGPAFRVNLRRGDVILAVNGREVNTTAAFEEAVAATAAGGTVTLRVNRGGQIIEGKVAVEEQPGP